MNDICNFIPPKNGHNNIEYYHFVYETEIKKFTQPIIRQNYYINIVFKGSGIMKVGGKEYRLVPGTLFFNFPFHPFRIECSNDFTFLYISFNGEGTQELLANFNVSTDNCTFNNFHNLSEFWMKAVRRINQTNAIALTESVLMYSLSYINEETGLNLQKSSRFESVLKYVNSNYKNQDISVMKVADMFFYNKKYLSSLFAKETGQKFTNYINTLRVQHAKTLLDSGVPSILEISAKCGFSDSHYFSKVFKKHTGMSPTQYIKNVPTST